MFKKFLIYTFTYKENFRWQILRYMLWGSMGLQISTLTIFLFSMHDGMKPFLFSLINNKGIKKNLFTKKDKWKYKVLKSFLGSRMA